MENGRIRIRQSVACEADVKQPNEKKAKKHAAFPIWVMNSGNVALECRMSKPVSFCVSSRPSPTGVRKISISLRVQFPAACGETLVIPPQGGIHAMPLALLRMIGMDTGLRRYDAVLIPRCLRRGSILFFYIIELYQSLDHLFLHPLGRRRRIDHHHMPVHQTVEKAA